MFPFHIPKKIPMRLLAIPVLFFVAMTLLLAQGPPSMTGAIRGQIIDADTHKPVAGIKAGALKPGSRNTTWAETDSAGRYALRILTPGKRRSRFWRRMAAILRCPSPKF